MDDRPLLDFAALGRRLRVAAAVLAGLAAAGVLAEALLGRPAGPAALRWGTGATAAFLLVTAALVALQAYRAADAIQRRGQRLSTDDVGLFPPRRPGGAPGEEER